MQQGPSPDVDSCDQVPGAERENTLKWMHVDQRVERTTAAFEKAAMLFNMAAAMSADAAAADLTSDAGCKRAARRYQVPHITLCSLPFWMFMPPGTGGRGKQHDVLPANGCGRSNDI